MLIADPLRENLKCAIIRLVTNLNPEICRKLRDARREAGLSQSVLAREVGCKQSALSMFEQGDGTKLNDEVVEKLCAKFGVELPKASVAPTRPVAVVPRLADSTATGWHANPSRGFCPNAACPSHQRYEVDGRLFLKPNRAEQDPVGGKYCAVCGELLEKRCPNCGAPVHDGAICSLCGDPYVPVAQ